MSKERKNKSKDIAKAEDVEFSYELADSEDLEAMDRMKKADHRAQSESNDSK